MARIKTYAVDTIISDKDIVIGSDAENLGDTRNYQVGDLRTFILSGLAPSIGGTLRITEITDDSGTHTDPSDVLNNLNPALDVVQYNVLIVSMQGARYLFKLQNITVGVLQEPVSFSDFIVLNNNRNVGDGEAVYIGYTGMGGSEMFRSIKSNGLNIYLNNDAIVINKKDSVNVGEGQPIYYYTDEGTNIDTFKTLVSVGLDISSSGPEVRFENKAGENLGGGAQVYKGINSSTKINSFRTIKSDTLNIVQDNDNDVITIDTPASATIPAIYVNNAYIPTYDDWNRGKGEGTTYGGDGTLAKPFTDTITYTDLVTYSITANTSISNAFTAYVGGESRLEPLRKDEKIIIQNNNGVGYTYSGDFNYSYLKLEVNAIVGCVNTGKLIDMDNSSYFSNSTSQNVLASITVNKDAALYVNGTGFWNSGNGIVTLDYSYKKELVLQGEGLIIDETTFDSSKYLINSGVSLDNKNAGYPTIKVSCSVSSLRNGICNVGYSSIVRFNKATIGSGDLSSVLDLTVKAFYLSNGGTIQMYDSNVSISNYGTQRNNAFVLDSSVIHPKLIIRNTNFVGRAVTWFNRLQSQGELDIVNCYSTYFSGTNLFDRTGSYLWSINFRNNIFEGINIDNTKVDLTQGNTISSINTIGANVIESLCTFESRASALYSLPIYSKFINTNSGSSDHTTWKVDIVI